MKIGDKVYIREHAAAGLSTGVIVAKKHVFDPWPQTRYVVKKVKAVENIGNVISMLFAGVPTDYLYCTSGDLIRIPDIATETTADTNPKNQALKGEAE